VSKAGAGIVMGCGAAWLARVKGMVRRRDDLRGVDDLIAEQALAGRAELRLTAAPHSRCSRRFMHPREATQFNDKCACVLPTDHDGGCLCEHGIERVVYWIDFDGREHYVTRGWPVASRLRKNPSFDVGS